MTEATAAPPPSTPVAGTPETAHPDHWDLPPKTRIQIAVIIALALCGALAILYAWRLPPFTGLAERTDDAYVRGFVTVISPQVNGYVTSVPVRDFEWVRAGQVLATIDDSIYKARVAQAEATVATQVANLANSEQAQRSKEASTRAQDAAIANAKAQLDRAQADMRRAGALVTDGSISARERDGTRAALLKAQADLQQAEASRNIGSEDVRTVVVGRSGLKAAVEQAQAQLQLARIDLGHTVIRAPVDGQLSQVGVRNGAYVAASTQLMFLVPREKWVVANYKETQTGRMRIGQAVRFSVDALGGVKLTGHVENLSPAAGSEFSILAPDNATGNFVKIAQRIAVRIKIDPGQSAADRLRPGMSVVVAVDTHG